MLRIRDLHQYLEKMLPEIIVPKIIACFSRPKSRLTYNAHQLLEKSKIRYYKVALV